MFGMKTTPDFTLSSQPDKDSQTPTLLCVLVLDRNPNSKVTDISGMRVTIR